MTDNPEELKRAKFIAEVPKEAGALVAMTEHDGKLFVACENGVYYLHTDGAFRPMMFLSAP